MREYKRVTKRYSHISRHKLEPRPRLPRSMTLKKSPLPSSCKQKYDPSCCQKQLLWEEPTRPLLPKDLTLSLSNLHPELGKREKKSLLPSLPSLLSLILPLTLHQLDLRGLPHNLHSSWYCASPVFVGLFSGLYTSSIFASSSFIYYFSKRLEKTRSELFELYIGLKKELY